MPQKPARTTARRSFPVTTTESLEGRFMMATQVFGNPTGINLFEDFNPPTPAFVYPSGINVDGVTGTISELRVTLLSVYHDRPEDMDVLVVNPAGKSVLVMSDAGDSFQITGDNAVDLTFTDTATKDLPETSQITAGVYRPTNYDNDDFFPGPDVPFGAPSDTTMADLATGDPNGLWRLYLVDDTVGNVGGIANGWNITFITGGTGPAAPSTPDLHPASDRGASNSDNITNVASPVFRGTASEGTQVRLFVDGVPSATGPVTNGNYQIQIGSALPDGVHAISARALDTQGNEGAVSGDLLVTIDTTRPDFPSTPDLTAASDTGPSNTDNDTTDTTPTFTGTAPGADSVQLLANGLPVGTAAVTNGTYTVTPTNALATGTYDFTVLSTDLAGNNSGQSDPLSVIIRQGTTTTPQITAVYARGSTWLGPDADPANVTFKEFLAANGLGDANYGFRVDNLAANTTLPWINVNEIVLKYDSALPSAPDASTIVLHGVRSDYTVTTSLIDPTTVLLSLARALGNLPAASGGGNDGDRITLTVPGAGAGGANYTTTINVLQGDVDRAGGRVTAIDLGFVKARSNRSTNDPGTTGATYTAYADTNGSGRIDAIDLGAVKARSNDSLPAAAAPAALFSSKRIADEVLA